MSERIVAIFLLIFIIISSITIPAQKVFAENDFYSSNDILFYDSKAPNCPGGSTINSSTTGTSESLTTILNYFTGKGLSLAAATGIAGNLYQESGLKPNIIQGGATAPDSYTPVNGTGFGIAQWTFTSRQQPLVVFAAAQGKNITDLSMQLDYLWQELSSGYYLTVLQDLNSIKSTSTFNSTSAPMAAAIVFHGKTDLIVSGATQEITDVTNSTIGFKIGFEGSEDTAQVVVNKRGRTAESYYNTYKSTITDGTGVVGINTAVAGSTSNSNGCKSSVAGDASFPDNVDSRGKGWTIKDNTDYSNVQCAVGTIDAGTYLHPTKGFTIRKCSTALGYVSSLMSQKALSMIGAAAQSGVTLTGGSWRSYESQVYLRTANGCPDVYISPSSSCITPTAIPGNSQHERGLAIDFHGIDRIGSGPEWDWLFVNAASFGFYNLASEGWHWSMSGG